MSEELEAKRRHLASLEDFLRSPAFLGYKAAMTYDIQATKDSIIAIEPLKLEDFVEELKLRGELRVLEQMLTTFEDARSNLETRIDEMAEAELQTANETKK